MTDQCPACGSASRETIASWADWERAAALRDDGPMRLEAARACGVADDAPVFRKCADCGSVALCPMPRPDQLSAFYQNYHAAGSFEAKAEKKISRASRRIRPLMMLTKGRRFLDVGGSIGTAAEAARRLGFEASSIELDEAAVEKGRELFPDVTHHVGVIDDLPAKEKFDLIFLAEIIEHVIDPEGLARSVFDRLGPGGIVFLTTPDAGHFRRPGNVMSWKSVKPPEHLTLFTRKGLRALFAKAGFSPIFFKPHLKPGARMVARRPRG
ncbi:class I SAM-dependent methyltransferase [Hyphococcus sp.]|uniref:class I SAM-dependent methyltransferase n=1 Tax=Hyphococcus sp. TaxID=2038636 RepID=UPI0035C75891